MASSHLPRRLDTSRLIEPRIHAQACAPRFGENYKTGYLGFTSPAQAYSQGLVHFSGWSRLGDIHAGHVFVVTAENECVEALPGKGIVKSPLEKYFKDGKTHVFFRKPRKCAAAIGARIADAALAQVGTKYDNLLLAAQLLESSFLRRWIFSTFRESEGQFLGRLLDRDPRWLAGELAAYCLDCQPEYADRGILGQPRRGMEPQALFEDEELFAAWSHEPPEQPDPALG